MGQKKKPGLSLRRKKEFFGPKFGKKLSIRAKIDQFKKKRLFGPKKNKLELSLSTKKGFFGTKIGEKKNWD